MHLRLLVLSALIFAPTSWAQSVFDHFPGNSVNEDTWWIDGNRSTLGVSSSQLALQLAPTDYVALVSNDYVSGNFDFVLDFSNLSLGGPNTSWACLSLTVVNADGPIGTLAALQACIGRVSGQQGFSCLAASTNGPIGGANLASNATAGELRLRRVAGTPNAKVEVLIRPSGQNLWTTLLSMNDFLSSAVHVEIWAETDSRASIAARCDRLTFVGTRLVGPRPVGNPCHACQALAYSRTNVGNQHFGIQTRGGPQLANRPTLQLLGFSQLNVGLAAAGAPGCSLYVTPDLVLPGPVLDTYGEGFFSFPIPNNVVYVGIPLNFQSVVAAPVNAFQLAFSNAVTTRILR